MKTKLLSVLVGALLIPDLALSCSVFNLTLGGETRVGRNLDWIESSWGWVRFMPATVDGHGAMFFGVEDHIWPQGGMNDQGLVLGMAATPFLAIEPAPEKLVAQELGRRELEMARDVQRRLLPPSEVTGPGWEVAARCMPARVVTGDFYDILRHADGSVDVVVADVAGKGFAASLIMASVKAMLPFVNADGGVAELLVRLNQRLSLELGRGEFVALAVARYSPSERLVELANAGAPDPYLMRPGQPPQPLSVPGPRLPLGIREQVAYASRTVELTADDRLLLLTDGLPEARDTGGEPLGYQELETMLSQEPPIESPSSWLTRLFDKIQRRTARAPEDDWTALMLVPRDARETP